MALERFWEVLNVLRVRKGGRQREGSTLEQGFNPEAIQRKIGEATELTLEIEDVARRAGRTDFEPHTITPKKP